MRQKIISQEMLKGIACITMLIDHVGAVFFPQYIFLRVIGRIAFPIYCFLLAEGVFHTRNSKRYLGRLLIGLVLAEVPFELLFYGEFTGFHQNVMFTLTLGAGMLLWMKRTGWRIVPLAVCFLVSRYMYADYGQWGIALIWVFGVSGDVPKRWVFQLLGTGGVFYLMNSVPIPVGGIEVPIQMFGLLAMVPIMMYSGKKTISSKAVQWAFYLFYPVHLAVLLCIHNYVA